MEKPEFENVTEDQSEPDTWKQRRILLIVVACLIVLGLIGTGTMVVYTLDQRRYISCQRDYNEATAAAIKERGLAGALDREAFHFSTSASVTMIKVILDPAATVEARRKAIEDWSKAQSAADKLITDANDQRNEHPLPEPRRC